MVSLSLLQLFCEILTFKFVNVIVRWINLWHFNHWLLIYQSLGGLLRQDICTQLGRLVSVNGVVSWWLVVWVVLSSKFNPWFVLRKGVVQLKRTGVLLHHFQDLRVRCAVALKVILCLLRHLQLVFFVQEFSLALKLLFYVSTEGTALLVWSLRSSEGCLLVLRANVWVYFVANNNVFA